MVGGVGDEGQRLWIVCCNGMVVVVVGWWVCCGGLGVFWVVEEREREVEKLRIKKSRTLGTVPRKILDCDVPPQGKSPRTLRAVRNMIRSWSCRLWSKRAKPTDMINSSEIHIAGRSSLNLETGTTF